MTRTDARTFLGFETPFLAAVARTLLAEQGEALADVVVVLPGRRAGRKLLEALIVEARTAIEPPRIVTEAGLAAALSKQNLALASMAAVEWAWFDALGRAKPEEWESFAPAATAASPWALRWSLARQLAALDREVATEEGVDGPREVELGTRARRSALAVLSARVRETLVASGRIDPARALHAVRDAAARRAGLQVVLAGVVEISPALRALLESLSPRPRILVQAGPDLAAGFDDLGAVVPEYWERREIPLRDADWRAVDDPAAAIAESLAWLAGLPPKTSTDALAIGVLGNELLPALQHALDRQGIALHSAAGESLRESAPYLALEALHAWVAREDFSALAAALRHPDLEACLGQAAGDAAARLDFFHAEHLPDAFDGELPSGKNTTAATRELRDALRALCAELGAREERPLSAWTAPIAALLCRIYPTLPDGSTPESQRARAALEWFSSLAGDLAGYGEDFFRTPIGGAQALRLWLDWAAGQSVSGAREPDGAAVVEALGWLELAFEDAPNLLLLGLNDGWVPQNERASPLGAPADESGARSLRARTRLARDVHALTAIAVQRAGRGATGTLQAISLRGAAGDDPLRPSRLLFHAPDATAIARAKVFFHKPQVTRFVEAPDPGPGSRATPILPMPVVPPLRSISVSGFKSFLESPYLFYLEKRLHLERVRDDAWELDPKGFGSLVHAILERWGKSASRDSTDAAQIESIVHGELDALAGDRFGARPLPAVRLQLQQLRRRLSRFAQCQALEAQRGWRVHDVESRLEGAFLEVDGARIEVHGTLDRIDRHTASGRWRILDYKTGERSNRPLAEHATKSRWKDLQLPLYRHFQSRHLVGEIELGYFAIPRSLDQCGVHIAPFKPEQLEAAVLEARRLLREMLAADFARVGRARPADRVQRALCGLSLLSLDDDASGALETEDGELAE